MPNQIISLKDLATLIQSKNFIVLDTETTGLRRPAEIIQISMIDANGYTLIDQYVNPKLGVPPAATAVHGMTAESLIMYPCWHDVRPEVVRLIEGKNVIVYNAKYDRHMMRCSDEVCGLTPCDYQGMARWYCAMEAFAEWNNEIDAYYGTPRWKPLGYACDVFGVSDDGAHNALADCTMTLLMLRHFAKAILAGFDTLADFRSGAI